MPGEGVGHAIVVVLVDDEEPERRVGLVLERPQQGVELLVAPERGHHEVERHARCSHAREAIVRHRPLPGVP